ncbi:hypothetical protein ACFWA5_50440 [Streptomyces mirabilis]|uniref:hypothetical protein n=1 Tax=Streptomyces mirabilis TaxID=68239 RepID=UPI0036477493
MQLPYVYRVTKYNPADRDEHGHYTGSEDVFSSRRDASPLKLEDPTRLDCRDLVPPGFLVWMLRLGIRGVGQALFRSVTAVARRR